MKNLSTITNSARRNIIKETIIGGGAVLLIIGAIFNSYTAHAGKSQDWADTGRCIDSYAGIVDYDIAAKGCIKKKLQGLAIKEANAILDLPDWQFLAIQKVIIKQANAKL